MVLHAAGWCWKPLDGGAGWFWVVREFCRRWYTNLERTSHGYMNRSDMAHLSSTLACNTEASSMLRGDGCAVQYTHVSNGTGTGV